MSSDFREAIKFQRKLIARFQYSTEPIDVSHLRSAIMSLEALKLIDELGLSDFIVFAANEKKAYMHYEQKRD
jgi:hypothetical protein